MRILKPKTKPSQFTSISSAIRLAILALGGICFSISASAQFTFNSTGDTYSSSFEVSTNGSSLPWTDNSTLPGWYGRANNAAATVYSISSGGNTTSGLMAYSPTAPDLSTPSQAFGSFTNGSANLLALHLVNSTGVTLSEATISFDWIQWWGGNGAPNDAFLASYRMGGTAPSGGAFVTVPELDIDTFVDGAGTLATPETGTITHTISGLNWSDGESLWVRWVDNDVSGGDAAAGFDSMTISVVPEPAFSVLMLGFSAICFAAMRRKKRA